MRIGFLFLALAGWLISGMALAQSTLPPQSVTQALPPKNMLFVGNSYTFYNNMPKILEAMLNADSKKMATYSVDQLTVGGAKIKDFVANGAVAKQLGTKKYDLVFLQEQSQTIFYTNEQAESIAAFKTMTDSVRRAGAKPIVWSTWARKAGNEFYTGPSYSNHIPPKNSDIMSKTIDMYFSRISKAYVAQYIPVGRYWDTYLKRSPAINLYDPDGSHPSPYGSYLITLLMFNTITGHLPDSSVPVPAGVDPAQARAMISFLGGK